MGELLLKREYSDIVFEPNNLRALGFADGYADFISDAENIVIHSYKLNNSKEFVFGCTIAYMEGYDVGSFMSENCSEIYDEEGNFKEDEYDIEPNVYDYQVEAIISGVIKTL